MTTLLFNPMTNLGQFQREINRLFNAAPTPRHSYHAQSSPLYEDADNLYVELAVPGIAPDSLEVTVEDGELRIKGERPKAVEEDVVAWRLKERSSGTFSRQFNLPEGIDREKVSAQYEHGILTITLPKEAAAKPKQIEIKVS